MFRFENFGLQYLNTPKSGQVFLGGVLTKRTSIVPLRGPTVVGVSARPYVTRRLPMLQLMHNLQACCEDRWVSKLSAHTLSLATCQRRAQEARERRERRESSPSISERIPKLKVQASALPATQTPKPLTGRGGGKKNLDLFATNHFPVHCHSKGKQGYN